MTRLCYVAEPLDYAEGGAADTMDACRSLQSHGLVLYSPRDAFAGTATAEPDRRVRQINHRAMILADCMLAFLPDGVRTIGVPMEIESAVAQLGIPCAVVGGRDSWALADRPGLARFDAWPQAVAWLLENTPLESSGLQRRGPTMYVKVDSGGVMPSRSYEGDAGFDLYVSENVTVRPGSFMDVKTDVSVEMPEYMWGMIVGRSSTLRTRGLLVVQGIIDGGYRGELYSAVWNMTDRPVEIRKGERIAQFIPQSNRAHGLNVQMVDRLGPSDRGERGFGSSGA